MIKKSVFHSLDLQKLILILIISSVSSLFLISIFVLNYVIKEQLTENSLAANQRYAAKIAFSTDKYFESMLSELKFSAHILGQNFSNQDVLKAEVSRLKNQSHKFNSITIVDKNAYIREYAPHNFRIDHKKQYKTAGIIEALKLKQTYISSPYKGLSNNLIVLIAQPIFNHKNEFLGIVTGSIYLNQENLVSELLATSYSHKKSYTYVIDNKNKIIFHPDQSRIGDSLKNNTGLKYITSRSSGNIALVNSKGIENLAGFAAIPSVNWIIVSQQPTLELLSQANAIIVKVTLGMLIFYLVLFIFVWKLSYLISSPLNKLAQMASMLTRPNIDQDIKKIDPWYFEALRFRTSLLLSSKHFKDEIAELKQHVNTDPLTELYNRRGMKLFLNELKATNTPFSVLNIDIDHFKAINDSYGHDQGDHVLKKLASHMMNNFRKHDICCRVGGEEFTVFVVHEDPKVAYTAAERLREAVAQSYLDPVGHITVSIGIASWPRDAESVDDVIKLADQKLYEAKNDGRNCTRISSI
ncbi:MULTISPECIES: sensor domain-containing diguanylate cyclase [unclassified Acinetobacter]|uniref:sensor domain-containing diguanylate cyclase n=3 Tax=Acinetobacter TaxID=469 RepID=UPI000A351687|nr:MULTISPECIES: sensor domain-containing diguanylate cyclase [unclassified Acinetobacter]OTG61206.1 sensor domain-containing diguanylate cyclase [Acinetobacter sp. ANC 4204]